MSYDTRAQSTFEVDVFKSKISMRGDELEKLELGERRIYTLKPLDVEVFPEYCDSRMFMIES